MQSRQVGEDAKGGEWLERTAVRRSLIATISEAIKEAMVAAPENLLRKDADRLLAQRLWATIDSQWLQNWHDFRTSYPQMEREQTFEVINKYVYQAGRPEMTFLNQSLNESHVALVEALHRYAVDVGVEVVSRADGSYMLSVKSREGLTGEEYDKEYDRQLEVVYSRLEGVWKAWNGYVDALRGRYPEMLHADADEDENEPG